MLNGVYGFPLCGHFFYWFESALLGCSPCTLALRVPPSESCNCTVTSLMEKWNESSIPVLCLVAEVCWSVDLQVSATGIPGPTVTVLCLRSQALSCVCQCMLVQAPQNFRQNI